MGMEFAQLEKILKAEAEKLEARVNAQNDEQAAFFASLPDGEEKPAESYIKPSFLGIAFATTEGDLAYCALGESLNLLKIKPEDFCHIIQKPYDKVDGRLITGVSNADRSLFFAGPGVCENILNTKSFVVPLMNGTAQKVTNLKSTLAKSKLKDPLDYRIEFLNQSSALEACLNLKPTDILRCCLNKPVSAARADLARIPNPAEAEVTPVNPELATPALPVNPELATPAKEASSDSEDETLLNFEVNFEDSDDDSLSKKEKYAVWVDKIYSQIDYRTNCVDKSQVADFLSIQGQLQETSNYAQRLALLAGRKKKKEQNLGEVEPEFLNIRYGSVGRLKTPTLKIRNGSQRELLKITPNFLGGEDNFITLNFRYTANRAFAGKIAARLFLAKNPVHCRNIAVALIYDLIHIMKRGQLIDAFHKQCVQSKISNFSFRNAQKASTKLARRQWLTRLNKTLLNTVQQKNTSKETSFLEENSAPVEIKAAGLNVDEQVELLITFLRSLPYLADGLKEKPALIERALTTIITTLGLNIKKSTQKNFSLTLNPGPGATEQEKLVSTLSQLVKGQQSLLAILNLYPTSNGGKDGVFLANNFQRWLNSFFATLPNLTAEEKRYIKNFNQAFKEFCTSDINFSDPVSRQEIKKDAFPGFKALFANITAAVDNVHARVAEQYKSLTPSLGVEDDNT